MTTVDPQLLELLGGDEGLDQRSRALLNLLASQAGETAGREAVQEDEWDNSRTAERAERGEALKRRYFEMAAELAELHHRNERLAQAVGACSNCWGETLGCRDCRGKGAPGSHLPDPTLYDAIVLPAVAAMGRTGDAN